MEERATAANTHLLHECLEDVFHVSFALGVGLHLFLQEGVRKLRCNPNKKTVLKHRNLNDLQKDFQRDILDHFNCRYDEREIRDDWYIRMKEETYASNHPCRLEKRFPL